MVPAFFRPTPAERSAVMQPAPPSRVEDRVAAFGVASELGILASFGDLGATDPDTALFMARTAGDMERFDGTLSPRPAG